LDCFVEIYFIDSYHAINTPIPAKTTKVASTIIAF
jgi:hypothetical protein